MGNDPQKLAMMYCPEGSKTSYDSVNLKYISKHSGYIVLSQMTLTLTVHVFPQNISTSRD